MRTLSALATLAVAALLAVAAPTAASAATCPVATSTYTNAITSTPGLVSYWRLGESSGTAACDSWGSNAGAYQGGYALGQLGALSGDPDTAVALDGSSGTVSVPDSASLHEGDSFTIEAWVKRGLIGGTENQTIASKQANSWLLMFNPSNRLVLRQSKVGDLVASTRTVADGAWHHVAATKSGSTVRLYIDGADVTGTVTNRTIADNTLPLVIGQSSGVAFYNGTLDEVALYGGALSASTVKAHYDRGVVSPTPTPAPDAPSDPVIAAAGDIACDPDDVGYNGGLGTADRCHQKATSDLLIDSGLTGVLTLGDEQYDDATLGKFQQVYAGTWGRANALVKPTPGNHEYLTSGAAGYFDYFNGVGNATGPAGDRKKGYFSFDLGAWHVIALNSNCSAIGGCGYGSPQETWLRNDLANHPNKCVMGYFHHPRFSSGMAGDNSSVSTLFRDLYNAGAEVALTAHDHLYERFAPQTPDRVRDDAKGIREFVVGTGGKSLVGWSSIKANSQVRDNKTFGVLRMTLHAGSYDWKFQPEAGKTFTDSGSTACH